MRTEAGSAIGDRKSSKTGGGIRHASLAPRILDHCLLGFERRFDRLRRDRAKTVSGTDSKEFHANFSEPVRFARNRRERAEAGNRGGAQALSRLGATPRISPRAGHNLDETASRPKRRNGRKAAPTDDAIAQVEDAHEDEEIPVLHVHVRFEPIVDEPEPKREPVVAKPKPELKTEPENTVERRVSYEIETPSADPTASSRPTDFQMDEADAPPRRRDGRSPNANIKRKPYVALTDVSPRLLFPRTYFDSPAETRSLVPPEPGVRQATWRPLDSKPSAASPPKKIRRGLVRRAWERFSRRFAPSEPIAK